MDLRASNCTTSRARAFVMQSDEKNEMKRKSKGAAPPGPRDSDDAPEITQKWMDSANLYHGERLVRRGRPAAPVRNQRGARETRQVALKGRTAPRSRILGDVREMALAMHQSGTIGKQTMREFELLTEHDTNYVTPAGRSALVDLASKEDAVELEMRSTLLRGLTRWLASSKLTRVEAAKMLGTTRAQMSDLKRGKISQFGLDLLIRLATRAGLRPKLRLEA